MNKRSRLARNAEEIMLNAISVAVETAWVLAALAQAHHIVHLCSGPSLVCLRVSSMTLGITLLNHSGYRRSATA